MTPADVRGIVLTFAGFILCAWASLLLASAIVEAVDSFVGVC